MSWVAWPCLIESQSCTHLVNAIIVVQELPVNVFYGLHWLGIRNCMVFVREIFSEKLIGSLCNVTGPDCVGTWIAVINYIKS